MGESAPVESILDALMLAYASRAPFREDRILAGELREEAAPVLEALFDALKQGTPLDQMHEAFALVTLLCRRAGVLGATPAAAHALIEALLGALRSSPTSLDDAVAERIRVVAFEGYCGGRDERLLQSGYDALAASQVSCVLAPRCVALVLSGAVETERLAGVLERFGRLALQNDAAACLLDVSRFSFDDDERVRTVFDGLATVASLGAALIVCARENTFAGHLARFHGLVPELRCVTDFSEALRLALTEAGYELKARRRWPIDLFSRARPSSSRS